MNSDRIDWSQLWYPGPSRVFTAAELARAGGAGPSRTLVVIGGINIALLAFAVLQAAPAQAAARVSALMLAAVALAGFCARRLWRNPSRWELMRQFWIYGIAGLVFGLGLHLRLEAGAERSWTYGVCLGAAVSSALGLWVLCLVRAEQIAARLRELDERERRDDMARQLAQAQIQPHFLFNSLASLQHWVQCKDDRAAPMLDALTGFLRATLPLFDRPLLSVGEEAEAVRQYLAVMRLRLGDRLRWQVDVDSQAATAALPPGLLLTLVENAIEHGVQRNLARTEVQVRADALAKHLRIAVRDSGPGIAGPVVEGVGLANARARLAQAFGDAAALTLDNHAEGGCVARIECPLTPLTP